jgi:drug/metabolite transporter (DMT)-like permease
LPGLGILLTITYVLLGQTTNVLVKKMTLSPLVLVLWRDALRLPAIHVPLLIHCGEHPFPKGSRVLLLVRGLTSGITVAVRAYAVRVLPLADYTMINSVNPVFVTLLSCIFLKEACGIFEIFNLLLVLLGVTLVVQPPFLFGAGEVEYSAEMLYTALSLVAVTALGSVIPIILRQLRMMHWAALASSSRFLCLLEYLPAVLLLGEQCLPACGAERVQVLLLAIIASAVQMLAINAYKFEEAHVITLVDNAANIVTAFVFQALFFMQAAGPVQVTGAGAVLASVLAIGARRAWAHRRAGEASRSRLYCSPSCGFGKG